MIWVGLTGGIGSGKSTTSDVLRQKGLDIIDADQIAKQLLHDDPDVHKEVRQIFGDSVFTTKGLVDHAKLADLVFASPESLQKLEKILHPRVRDAVEQKKRRLQGEGKKIAFYDVPLLFEKNITGFDAVVVVYCPESIQRERIRHRNSWNEEQINARLAAQIDIEVKKKQADYVIDNSNSIASLNQEVDRVLQEILQSGAT